MTQDLQTGRSSRPDQVRQATALPSSPPIVRRPPSPASGAGPAPRTDGFPAHDRPRPIAGSAVPRFAPEGWRPGDDPASGWAVRPPSGRGPANVDTRPNAGSPPRGHGLELNVDTRPTGRNDHDRPAENANVDTRPNAGSPPRGHGLEPNVDTTPSSLDGPGSRPFTDALPTRPALGVPSVVPSPDQEMAALVEARRRRLDGRRLNGREDEIENPENETELQGLGTGPTRTMKTTEKYVETGNQLKNRYRRVHGMPRNENPDPIKFANFVLGIRMTIKPTSWRVYRQGALIALQGMDSDDVEQAVAMIEGALEPDSGEARVSHVRREPDGSVERTSAHKAKSLTHEQYHALLRDLPRLTSSDYQRPLAAWIVASLATGLRPSEWEVSTLTSVPDPTVSRGRRIFLHVANAKATNGRANGETRTLELTGLTDDGIEAIETWMEVAADWAHDGVFMKNKEYCSRILRKVSKQIFQGKNSKLLTLYTLRHQFVANMKTIYPQEELAALLGHANPKTQSEWYGKKRSAWAPEHITDIPAPVEAEVALVRQRLAIARDRIRVQTMVEKANARNGAGAQPAEAVESVAPSAPDMPSSEPSSGA